jgi:hypothetical protein
MDESDQRRLQEKRSANAEKREAARLRSTYGPLLASSVARNTGISLSLDDFKVTEAFKSRSPLWTGPVSSADGLVSGAADAKSISALLKYISNRLGSLGGCLSFEGAYYLGEVRLTDFHLDALLRIAEETEHTVVFHAAHPAGLVAVDFFPDVTRTYSLIVKGPEFRHVVTEWSSGTNGR